MNNFDETVASCSAPQEALWDCPWNLRHLREDEGSVFDHEYDNEECTAQDVKRALTNLRAELDDKR